MASNIDMTVRNINDHVEEFDRGLFGFLSLKYFVCASVSCFDLARACILEGYKTKWIKTQSLMNLICISCKRHFTMKLHTSIYILHHPTGIFFLKDNVMGSGRVNLPFFQAGFLIGFPKSPSAAGWLMAGAMKSVWQHAGQPSMSLETTWSSWW